MPPANPKFGKFAKKKAKPRAKVKRRDPIYIDGARPRPMYVDYKDLELLGKLVNRQAKILGRRKSGCTAASQHAVTSAGPFHGPPAVRRRVTDPVIISPGPAVHRRPRGSDVTVGSAARFFAKSLARPTAGSRGASFDSPPPCLWRGSSGDASR